MQNKTLKDLLNEEADRLLEEISELLRIIEPFAKGDYVSFGIRKDLFFEIGAKANENGHVDENTAYEVYTDGDKIVIKVLKDTGNFVCDGDCENCPIAENDCIGACENCPCFKECDDAEVNEDE